MNQLFLIRGFGTFRQMNLALRIFLFLSDGLRSGLLPLLTLLDFLLLHEAYGPCYLGTSSHGRRNFREIARFVSIDRIIQDGRDTSQSAQARQSR